MNEKNQTHPVNSPEMITNPPETFPIPQWVSDTVETIEEKYYIVAERNQKIIPYTTADGRFDDMTKSNICWWTNSFWGGMPTGHSSIL